MMENLKLYLSYHHNDNVSIDEDKGWVEDFSRLLGMMVGQVYNIEITYCNSNGDDGFMKTRPGNTDATIIILLNLAAYDMPGRRKIYDETLKEMFN